jgi:DNA-binding SARP family transcriptional activator
VSRPAIGSLSTGYRPRRVLEFRILGPLEVLADGRPVRLGGPRQRATLAILLLNANRVVPVERLADELYAGRPPVTAVTQVQRQVSELRRALGSPSAIGTRPPGYVVQLAPEQLDLSRFESLTERAADAQPRDAAELLRQALTLWRGPALADLEYEPFARAPIERLEELRLAALEARIDADLQLGREAAVAAEVEALAAEHPLREQLRAQWMTALYRSGRQAEALAAYRATRRELVEHFGLEPSKRLQALERAILEQDASLDRADAASRVSARTVLVAPSRDDALEPLVSLVRPLADARGGELLLARLVRDERALETAVGAVAAYRPLARTAAFTSDDGPADVIRLATANDADIVLVDAPPGLEDGLPSALAALWADSPAHVAALVVRAHSAPGAIFVPFGGGEHDWAALELAGLLASTRREPLRLVGTRADERNVRRDASRLLADAALAVQRLVDVDVSPLLADPRGLVEAVDAAALVVVGISPRWRHEGIGESRRALVRAARPPVLLVHAGPRPGPLAPHELRTRFTWTIGA